MSAKYTLSDGRILKGDEEVGTYIEEGNKVLLYKKAPYLYKPIKDLFAELEKDEPVFDVAPENEKPAPLPTTPPPVSNEHVAGGAEQFTKKSPEPAPESDRGDLDLAVVEWRKNNWPENQFNAMYPPARLAAAGIEL